MMIFSLVAMTGLEKCCITSAYLQWLCHSGERPVARGALVFVLLLFGPILKYRKNKSAKGSYELIIYPCFCVVSSIKKHFSLDAANFSLFY